MTDLTDKVSEYASDVPEWQIASELNAPDATLPKKRVNTPVSEVRALLLTSGAWPKIILSAENAATPTDVRALCITVRDSMVYLQELHTSDSAIYATISGMADGLLIADIIDQATHDKLVALAFADQSWADVHNGGVPVTARDVGLARGGKA